MNHRWAISRSGSRQEDDHTPHMPHDDPKSFSISVAIAAVVGLVIVGGTLALFG